MMLISPLPINLSYVQRNLEQRRRKMESMWVMISWEITLHLRRLKKIFAGGAPRGAMVAGRDLGITVWDECVRSEGATWRWVDDPAARVYTRMPGRGLVWSK